MIGMMSKTIPFFNLSWRAFSNFLNKKMEEKLRMSWNLRWTQMQSNSNLLNRQWSLLIMMIGIMEICTMTILLYITSTDLMMLLKILNLNSKYKTKLNTICHMKRENNVKHIRDGNKKIMIQNRNSTYNTLNLNLSKIGRITFVVTISQHPYISLILVDINFKLMEEV